MRMSSMRRSFNSVIYIFPYDTGEVTDMIKIDFNLAEASGKWPNELNAVRRVKAAFYLQITQALRKKFELKTRVNIDSLDVIKGRQTSAQLTYPTHLISVWMFCFQMGIFIVSKSRCRVKSPCTKRR